MLTVYHVPGTRSVRVLWVCEELGVEYQVERIPFTPDYRFGAEWLARNPVGKVPAMDVNGEFTMFESGAMVQFIIDRFGDGRLQPVPGTRDGAAYLQWSWFAEATFLRPVGDILQHTLIRPESERIASVAEDGRRRAAQCLDAVERAVTDREFLLDAFSGADIMLGYALMLAERTGVLREDAVAGEPGGAPHALAYLRRLQSRAAWKVAVA